jgi:hypothetical protein
MYSSSSGFFQCSPQVLRGKFHGCSGMIFRDWQQRDLLRIATIRPAKITDPLLDLVGSLLKSRIINKHI